MARKEELTFIIRAKNLFAKGFADARKGFRSIAKSAANMARSIGIGVAAAAGVMVAFGKSALAAYKTQARAEANLAATLKATGYAAGFTASQLKNQASEMQKLTGVGDDVIIKSQAILATFKEVKGDTFTQATAAIVDMATVMSGASGDATDLQSATVMVGKALNEPIKGIASLRRVGVQLTKQQEEQIRAFVESGQVAKAQAVILGELQSQFGGAAKALDGNVKAIDVLKAAYGDMQEQIGKAIAESQGFSDIIKRLQDAIDQLATSGELEEWIDSAIDGLGAVADAAMGVVSSIAWIGKALRLDKIPRGARMIGATVGGAMGGMEWGEALDEAWREEEAADEKREKRTLARKKRNAQKAAQTDAQEQREMLAARRRAAVMEAMASADATPDALDEITKQRAAIAREFADTPEWSVAQIEEQIQGIIDKQQSLANAIQESAARSASAYGSMESAATRVAETMQDMIQTESKFRAIAATTGPGIELATQRVKMEEAQRQARAAHTYYQTLVKIAKTEDERRKVMIEANKKLAEQRKAAQDIRQQMHAILTEEKERATIAGKTAKHQAAIATLEKVRRRALVLDVRDPREERAELFERKARKERIRDETREDRDRARRIRERMANLSPLGRIRRRDREWLRQYEEGRARIRTAEQAEKQIAKREAMIARLAQKTVDHLAAIRENLDTLLRAS